MNTIIKTNIFSEWLLKLKDEIGKSAIITRINRAKKNNFGDHKFLGNGIYEMRIMTKSGYRIYYAKIGNLTYILLCGGNKSTQKKDIDNAIEIFENIKKVYK